MSLQLLVPDRLLPDIPYTQALPLAVNIPHDDLGKGEKYIDDSIFVTPDLGNNMQKLYHLLSTQ